MLRDPNLASDQRNVNRWFDVGAFGAPAPGRFGTSAKGVIKGPGVNIWHMGVAKSICIHGACPPACGNHRDEHIQHPQWSNPRTTVTAAASAGIITGVGGVRDQL